MVRSKRLKSTKKLLSPMRTKRKFSGWFKLIREKVLVKKLKKNVKVG